MTRDGVSASRRVGEMEARIRRFADSPIRLAILVCSLWALGVVAVTSVGLIVEASRGSWQGLAAPANVFPALAFAVLSYLFRFLRWHLLARRVAPTLRLGESFTIGAIGFSLAMTPGRIGEALKLFILRQRAAVPVASSASVLLLERASEGLGFLLLAVAASLFLPWTEAFRGGPNAMLLVVGLLTLVVVVAFRQPIMAAAASATPTAARLPGLRRISDPAALEKLWSDFAHGGDRVLGWSGVLAALGLSVVARLCDGLTVFWMAGLFGIALPLAAAWFIIGTAGFIGGLTMLPGGAGAVEVTMAGLLVAFGGGAAAAFATVLASRILIFWVWVALGLVLALRYSVTTGVRSQESGVGDRSTRAGESVTP